MAEGPPVPGAIALTGFLTKSGGEDGSKSKKKRYKEEADVVTTKYCPTTAADCQSTIGDWTSR